MWPDTCPLAALSVTWRDAPSRTRELAANALDDRAWTELGRHSATGLVAIHTCARSLWLLSGPEAGWLGSLVQAQVALACGFSPPVLRDAEAARFVLRVSIGLDSFVQGEADIGKQVAAGFADSRAKHRMDATTNAVEQAVAHLGSEAQKAGCIRPNRGVGRLAVEWLVRAGADPTRPVAVVGTGSIGQRVITSLEHAQWATPVRYNRTPAPDVLPLAQIGEHEAIVVCTAAPGRWLQAKAKFIVDLGMPAQALAPTVGLDELLAGDVDALPSEALARGEAAMEAELRLVIGRLRSAHRRRQIAETNRLRDRFIDHELEGVLASELSELDPDQRRKFVRAASLAIRKYNHQLVAWLRDGAEGA